jgi:hypothetical protein
MPTPRLIPYDQHWLRRYFKRFAVTLALNASERDVEDICNRLPAAQWAKLASAWRQRRYRQRNRQHAWHTDCRQLAKVWRQLIRMQCISGEDALKLGATGDPSAYSDPLARMLVKSILSSAVGAFQAKMHKETDRVLEETIA